MRNLVFVLSFLLLFAGSTGCAETKKQVKKEEIEEKDDFYTWDFGRVREGETVKHTFIFRNESLKNLTIKEIKSSCGCTASEAEHKFLRPGESTPVEVSFNSKGYSGTTKQYVYLHTDDVDKPVVKLTIKARVE